MKEEKNFRVKEQIELNLYKDERNNWRYNCDKLKVSGGFCPQIFAEELDKKYKSKDQTIHITFPGETPEDESENYGGIYETLKQNECYLITKTGDRILVASNRDGKVELEYISIATEDDAMAGIYAIGAGRAIGAGINTLLKMLSEQEGKRATTPIKEKEPDIISNTSTGQPKPTKDDTSIYQHRHGPNF